MKPKNRFAELAAVIVIGLTSLHAEASAAGEDPPAGENAAAVAQPTADVSEQATDSVMDVKTQSMGGIVVSGGTMNLVFFGALGMFSLWAVTVSFERMFNLRREKVLPQSFRQQLIQLTNKPQSNATQFLMLCDCHNAPASRILKAGVMRSGRPLPEVEKSMEDAAVREMAAIRAKSRVLTVIGNVAPLVGLLGTVVGLILAFQVSSQAGLGKAERLAEGIYLALITTAGGLTIAIPCLLFASWFAGRADRYMCEVGECLTLAMPSFAQMEGQPLPVTTSSTTLPTAPPRELTPRERFLREAGIEV